MFLFLKDSWLATHICWDWGTDWGEGEVGGRGSVQGEGEGEDDAGLHPHPHPHPVHSLPSLELIVNFPSEWLGPDTQAFQTI